MVFDTGYTDYSSLYTCFCKDDLCNEEHFCDSCSANSAPAATFSSSAAAALLAAATLLLGLAGRG